MTDRDLDLLFERATRATRPSAEFEEELLVRLEEAVDRPSAEHPAPDDPVLAARHTARSEERSRVLLAVAAAVVIVVTTAVLLVVPGRDQVQPPPVADGTLPVPDALESRTVDRLGETCEAQASRLQAFIALGEPLPFSALEDRDALITDHLAELSEIVEEFDAAITDVLGDPALPAEVIDEVSALADRTRGQAGVPEQGEQLKFSLPLIARQLAAAIERLADAGVSQCEQDPREGGDPS